MDYELRTERYEQSAIREDNAAAHATSQESARVHQALAEMYRHEAAKSKSLHVFLKLIPDC